MGDKVKVAVLEINGVEEVEASREMALTSDKVEVDPSALLTDSPDLTGLDDVDTILAALANRHFGKNFAQAFTSGTFSTTSSIFQTTQTITQNLEAGNYIAFSHAKYLKTLISGQLGIRFLLNGGVVNDEEEVALDDDDYFFGHTSIIYLANVPAGSNTLLSQMRKLDGGGEVQTRERLLILWRVS